MISFFFKRMRLLIIISVAYSGFNLIAVTNSQKIGHSCTDDKECDKSNFEVCGLSNQWTELKCTCNVLDIKLEVEGEPPIQLELELEAHEDNVCRGPIGYPCKSHPLQGFTTHASCGSEFCDEALDKCTSPESVKTQQRSDASSYINNKRMLRWQNFAVTAGIGVLFRNLMDY